MRSTWPKQEHKTAKSCHVISCQVTLDILACGNMAIDSEKKKLLQSQNTVKRCAAIVMILSLFYVMIAVYLPFRQLHLPTLLDRVVFTLRCSMVSLLVVVAGIMIVAQIRFHTTAINPLDPSGQKITETFQRCLNNTLEQFLVHVLSLMVLSTYIPEGQVKCIPYLVVWFVIGRAVFCVGYFIDPIKRGVGFAMNWFANLAVVGYCFYCMCVYGVQASDVKN